MKKLELIDIGKFNSLIFSTLDNILLPQINVQFDCWLSNLFCHFLDFTDYYTFCAYRFYSSFSKEFTSNNSSNVYEVPCISEYFLPVALAFSVAMALAFVQKSTLLI